MVKPNKACETCGKPFYASPGHTAQGWGKYCSLACRNYKDAGHPRWSGKAGTHTCPHCSREFHRRPGHASRIKVNYCSKACYIAASHVSKPCKQCGLPFTTFAAWTRRGTSMFCSRQCSSVWRSGHMLEQPGRGRGGRRADLNNIYLRSSWEANYARYLNTLVATGTIQGWAYEVDTFEFTTIKRGNRAYTPDFKVTLADGSIEYHEVKGYMDAKSKTKLNRMRRHYPLVNLVVIDRVAYKAIKASAKAAIDTWEVDGI